jgi:two-component system LytT family response regulator
MPLRVVIADDEPLARERLLHLLKKQHDIEIAGVATNGLEAVQQISDLKPDVLFLDIKMPELDGFGVLREIEPAARPVTIFVTAFDNYAIQAFEAQGVDYLLKPFSDERFEAALSRARHLVETKAVGELGLRLARLLDQRAEQAPAEYLERIVIKSGGRVMFLGVSEIDWIEAAGVYVHLHAGANSYLYRSTLGQIEKRLNPKEFARVNRSAIVRLDRIAELYPLATGRDYSIVLKTGKEVTLSKGYRPQLEAWLRQSL